VPVGVDGVVGGADSWGAPPQTAPAAPQAGPWTDGSGPGDCCVQPLVHGFVVGPPDSPGGGYGTITRGPRYPGVPGPPSGPTVLTSPAALPAEKPPTGDFTKPAGAAPRAAVCAADALWTVARRP